MEQSLTSSSNTQPPARQQDSTFGVQSLADTLEAAFGSESTPTARRTGSFRSTQSSQKETSRAESHSSAGSAVKLPGSFKTIPQRKPRRKLSSHASSTPLTPLHTDALSPGPMSGMPSTPSAISLQSLKLSDEDSVMDESGSQAVTSSGEEDGAEAATQQASMASFPQLVMPSIQMPSRRPFTTKGKAMGKLKIMVAGESGAYSRSCGKRHFFRGYVSLTTTLRHRQNLPRPFHSPSLRRHRARRPSIFSQVDHSCAAICLQVSQTKFRQGTASCDHRDTCQHKAISALVVRYGGESTAAEAEE
jgi:hypothetical protein